MIRFNEVCTVLQAFDCLADECLVGSGSDGRSPTGKLYLYKTNLAQPTQSKNKQTNPGQWMTQAQRHYQINEVIDSPVLSWVRITVPVLSLNYVGSMPPAVRRPIKHASLRNRCS